MKEMAQIILALAMLWMVAMLFRTISLQRQLAKLQGVVFQFHLSKPLQQQMSAFIVMVFAFTFTTSPTFLQFNQEVATSTGDWYRETIQTFEDQKAGTPEVVISNYTRSNDLNSPYKVTELLEQAHIIYEDVSKTQALDRVKNTYTFGEVTTKTRISSLGVYEIQVDEFTHIVHIFEEFGVYYFYDETVNLTLILESAN